MREKYLPLGTVCLLKGEQNYIMIIGFCVSGENVGEVHDYLGCIYPFGVMSSEINFVFNHEQIEQIIYPGFENDMEEKFKIELKKQMVQKENNTMSKVSSENSKVEDSGNIVTQYSTLNTLDLNEDNSNN